MNLVVYDSKHLMGRRCDRCHDVQVNQTKQTKDSRLLTGYEVTIIRKLRELLKDPAKFDKWANEMLDMSRLRKK